MGGYYCSCADAKTGQEKKTSAAGTPSRLFEGTAPAPCSGFARSGGVLEDQRRPLPKNSTQTNFPRHHVREAEQKGLWNLPWRFCRRLAAVGVVHAAERAFYWKRPLHAYTVLERGKLPFQGPHSDSAPTESKQGARCEGDAEARGLCSFDQVESIGTGDRFSHLCLPAFRTPQEQEW